MSEAANLLDVKTVSGGIHLVRLMPSKILDELQINSLGRQLGELIDNGARKVILDFDVVDHLSSSALGVLITTRQILNKVDGSLRLCNIRPDILQVFKITNLDNLFPIYPTVADALAGFEK